MGQSGFNRIEILVLLTIVIGLILLFLNLVLDIQRSIRDSKRRGDIEDIAKQLEVHYNRNPGQFCPDTTLDTYCQLQNDWFSSHKIPQDPLTGESYLNLPHNGDRSFMVCAKLEKNTGNFSNNQSFQQANSNSGYYYCSRSQQ